jgi:hypothetical protein
MGALGVFLGDMACVHRVAPLLDDDGFTLIDVSSAGGSLAGWHAIGDHRVRAKPASMERA